MDFIQRKYFDYWSSFPLLVYLKKKRPVDLHCELLPFQTFNTLSFIRAASALFGNNTFRTKPLYYARPEDYRFAVNFRGICLSYSAFIISRWFGRAHIDIPTTISPHKRDKVDAISKLFHWEIDFTHLTHLQSWKLRVIRWTSSSLSIKTSKAWASNAAQHGKILYRWRTFTSQV